MANWPGNPVASMGVDNFHGGTDSWVTGSQSVATQQTVSDVNITFTVGIEYHDHPYLDHGIGYFSARLNKLTSSGWQQVDFQSKQLGNDNDDGDWYDTLSVSVAMSDPVEQYQLALHDETQATSLGTSEDLSLTFQAIQGQAAIGDFTLDFVPVTIVYSPPGQDMTNALTQSESFGTRFTIGESMGFESDTNVSFKVSFLGIIGEGVGFSASQSVSNQSTSGIQISHFRNTTVTADNQKAIGRAYWGPLSDIFVLMVNPSFAASRRADGTMFYCMKDIEQVLLIPARKLLRPDGDPIAGAIPADVRQRLLQLDPFITNLNLFFPDSGADLSSAANPFADPSPNNRAELIGRWWVDGGTVVNYSVGETVQLLSTETNEVKYSSGVSINASAGVNYDGIAAALGLSQSNTTTIGMQSSQENDAGFAKNAACFLIRNQNEHDLDGIELYFDKIFSTFMFRRLRSRRRKEPIQAVGTLLGSIYGADGTRMRAITVTLIDEQGNEHQTGTRVDGSYSFYNVPPGKYTLAAGDQRKSVIITPEAAPTNPVRLDVEKVRRLIDLHQSPVWEVSRALGLPSDVVRKTVPRLPRGAELQQLGKAAGVDPETIGLWQKTVVLHTRPSPPKLRRKHHRKDHDDDDGKKRGPSHGRRK